MPSKRRLSLKYQPDDGYPALVDPATEVAILSRFVSDERLARFAAVMAARDWGLLPVCDRFRHPHNTSAVLRSAEAMGLARALILDDRNPEDPGYRMSRGVARGAQKWMPIEYFGTAEQLVEWAVAQGYRLLVAENSGKASHPHELQLPPRVALVVGSELAGVHEVFRQAAFASVKVETTGFTTSLNVSCAAAVLIEALRRNTTRQPEPVPPEERDTLLRRWLRRSVRNHRKIIERFAETP